MTPKTRAKGRRTPRENAEGRGARHRTAKADRPRRSQKALRDERRLYEEVVADLLVPPGSRVSLARDHDPAHAPDSIDRDSAEGLLERGTQLLSAEQEKLYAQNTWSVLVILQAMDAAGKDGTIKHVMSGVNPLGCQVFSFKAPSAEELDHDYLWRAVKALPERGRIGIFNRSYYEEVLVARVHPEILARQQLPPASRRRNIWKRRFAEINHFERYLVDNGTIVLKFFLNVSRDEQKKRFLERIDEPEKHWKFSARDVLERSHWDEYMRAYEDVFRHTSTPWAPWYVVPADRKWFTRVAVCATIVSRMQALELKVPSLSPEHLRSLRAAGRRLRAER